MVLLLFQFKKKRPSNPFLFSNWNDKKTILWHLVFSFWFLATGWSSEKNIRSSFSFSYFVFNSFGNTSQYFFFYLKIITFVQKLCHLLFTHPTQHLSFALNQIAIPRFPESPRNENCRGIGIPSPTQHLSFALNHLSWARETNCLNCYLLLLFQCYYYLIYY